MEQDRHSSTQKQNVVSVLITYRTWQRIAVQLRRVCVYTYFRTHLVLLNDASIVATTRTSALIPTGCFAPAEFFRQHEFARSDTGKSHKEQCQVCGRDATSHLPRGEEN